MTKDEAAILLQRLVDGTLAGTTSYSPAVVEQAHEMHALLSEAFEAQASDADIAAYVDGTLEGEDLRAFEAMLVASPDLRDEVDDLRDRVAELTLDHDATAPVAAQTPLAALRAAILAKRPLTMDQQRSLFANPALRADYNAMIRGEALPLPVFAREPVSETPSLSMPARIAASSDKVVNDRSFPGGDVRIRSAGRPNLLQVRIEVTTETFPYTMLELRGSDGVVGCLSFRPPDHNVSTRTVDLNDPHDAEAIGLLRDIRSVGTFKIASKDGAIS